MPTNKFDGAQVLSTLVLLATTSAVLGCDGGLRPKSAGDYENSEASENGDPGEAETSISDGSSDTTDNEVSSAVESGTTSGDQGESEESTDTTWVDSGEETETTTTGEGDDAEEATETSANDTEDVSCDAGTWNSDFIDSQHDLTPLAHHTEVQGSLVLFSGTSDLEPLRCLRRVRGELVFSGTDLRNLDGLDRLESVGGLRISGNEVLENVRALGNLVTVAGDLVINGNPELVRLDGLESLTYVSTIEINTSVRLESVSALTNAEYSGLLLRDLPEVVDVDKLTSGEQVLERVELVSLPLLRDLTLFQGVEEVEVELTLANLPELKDLRGLEDLRSAKRIYLASLQTLANIDALNPDRDGSLTAHGVELEFNACAPLSDCDVQTLASSLTMPTVITKDLAECRLKATKRE